MKRFTDEERARYSRHLLLDGIGEEGQFKLKSAKVLVVGTGGLGCPALLYLSAAGVGTVGIVDFDIVDASNLQRQVLFTVEDIGKSKSETASAFLRKQNPFLNITTYNYKLTVKNALEIIRQYDLVIDGTDNFSTRYMLNDACVLLDKPLIYGGVFKYNGQVSVLNAASGDLKKSATYRCIFPVPPDPTTIKGCEVTGVLGALTGLVGTIQAMEAIKMITGLGTALVNKLLLIDSLTMAFTTLEVSRNESVWKDFPNSPGVFSTMNYDYFCNMHETVKTIEVQEFEVLIGKDPRPVILDVRESWESEEKEGWNVQNIPLNDLINRHMEIDPNNPTIVVCNEGNNSRIAVKFLQDKFGFQNLVSLAGGLKNWEKSRMGISHD